MKILTVALTVALVICSNSLRADLIPVATLTEGTLAVHYNADQPSQVAYYQLQYSPTNTNGAAISFISPFDTVFGDQGQFGLSVIQTADTNDGSTPIPTLTAVDYNGVGPVPSGETINWATNDYKGNTPNGPQNPANVPYNSLTRGASVDVTASSLTNVGPIYSITATGALQSDGSIHWFDPGLGTTSLASLGLSNDFLFFTATFSDNIGQDPGLTNFTLDGPVTIFAQTIPEPGAAILLAIGLAGPLGCAYRRRKLARA